MRSTCLLFFALATSAGARAAPLLEAQDKPPCAQHARDCPAPPVINGIPAAMPAPPPSDALILFGGKDLSEWRSGDGSPARWMVRGGYWPYAAPAWPSG